MSEAPERARRSLLGGRPSSRYRTICDARDAAIWVVDAEVQRTAHRRPDRAQSIRCPAANGAITQRVCRLRVVAPCVTDCIFCGLERTSASAIRGQDGPAIQPLSWRPGADLQLLAILKAMADIQAGGTAVSTDPKAKIPNGPFNDRVVPIPSLPTIADQGPGTLP